MKIYAIAIIFTFIIGCVGIMVETLTLTSAMLVLIAINSTALVGKFILDWDRFEN